VVHYFIKYPTRLFRTRRYDDFNGHESAVVAYFRVIFRKSPEEIEENHKISAGGPQDSSGHLRGTSLKCLPPHQSVWFSFHNQIFGPTPVPRFRLCLSHFLR
jgi:hypothetical protein